MSNSNEHESFPLPRGVSCPDCGTVSNLAIQLTGPAGQKPAPETITVCARCGAILTWNDAGDLVAFDRWREIPNPGLVQMLERMQLGIRSVRRAVKASTN